MCLASDGTLYLYDGSRDAADQYAGILDSTYLAGAWARYGYAGAVINGFTGLTTGSVLYAAAGAVLLTLDQVNTAPYAGTWAIEAAQAISDTSVRVLRGEIFEVSPVI